MKATIEVELVSKFYGLVNDDVTKEDLLAGVFVEFNHPKTILGKIDKELIVVSFGEITSLAKIPKKDLAFFGLEAEEGMKAIKFDQPVFFGIEIEIEDGTDQEELLNSLDLDWEITNYDFELETDSTTSVSCVLRII